MQRDIKLSDGQQRQHRHRRAAGRQLHLAGDRRGREDAADGGTITVTQSAVNLEDLLGKFIFNVGSLADAAQKQMDA